MAKKIFSIEISCSYWVIGNLSYENLRKHLQITIILELLIPRSVILHKYRSQHAFLLLFRSQHGYKSFGCDSKCH